MEKQICVIFIGKERCFSSDMPRAAKTAEAIYSGEIVKMQELREIQYPHFKMISNRKLPFLLCAWKINHKSFPEKKYHVRKRIAAALDKTFYKVRTMFSL